jgi:hypothetical protein
VEILSKATANTDRDFKKTLYQNTFRTPNYFWFDPVNLEFKGFHLINGKYQEIEANQQNWLWSEQLELYLGIYEGKLRFFTPEGNLAPLPEEELGDRLKQERQRTEQERQRAERAEQEIARLKQLLKTQGIE